VNTPGVAADLSHIDTPAEVKGYLPPDDGLKKALAGADIVIIPAGVPRKPGVCVLVIIRKRLTDSCLFLLDDSVRRDSRVMQTCS
jgi:malate/lactate dehydrogenase